MRGCRAHGPAFGVLTGAFMFLGFVLIGRWLRENVTVGQLVTAGCLAALLILAVRRRRLQRAR